MVAFLDSAYFWSSYSVDLYSFRLQIETVNLAVLERLVIKSEPIAYVRNLII